MPKKIERSTPQSPLPAPAARGSFTLQGHIRLDPAEADKLRLRLGDRVLVQRDPDNPQMRRRRRGLRLAAEEFRRHMKETGIGLDELLDNLSQVRISLHAEKPLPGGKE